MKRLEAIENGNLVSACKFVVVTDLRAGLAAVNQVEGVVGEVHQPVGARHRDGRPR